MRLRGLCVCACVNAYLCVYLWIYGCMRVDLLMCGISGKSERDKMTLFVFNKRALFLFDVFFFRVLAEP